MLIKQRIVQDVFSDKSSLVVRALLGDPGRPWTIPALSEKEGVSTGLVMAVFKVLQEEGFLSRHSAGRFSHTRLRSPEKLLEKWTGQYRFSRNKQVQFHSERKDLLPKMRDYLEAAGIPYALTLFSGAGFVAPHVMGQGTALYLGVGEDGAEDALWKIQSRFSLISPRAGGNVCLALPYYKSSVFRDARTISGYRVASSLQLYLDLINFPVGGAEQAEWLKARLKEKGAPLVGEGNHDPL